MYGIYGPTNSRLRYARPPRTASAWVALAWTGVWRNRRGRGRCAHRRLVLEGLARLTGSIVLAVVATVGWAQETDFELDVVRLLDSGAQVKGTANLVSSFQGITYHFADPQSRQLFESNPTRYAAMMDGGCARMGSLSGRGRPDLFLVHEGRLFLFASEACRTTFQKNPDRFLERDDQIPEFTDEAMKRGRALLHDAVTTMGGAQRIDAIRTFEKSFSRKFESGGIEYDHQYRFLTDFQGRVREKNVYNSAAYVRVLNGEDSFFQDRDQVRKMYPTGQREMQRLANRDLLTLLKSREQPDFVAAVNEAETGQSIALVVALNGTVAKLWLEPTTRLPMAVEYRGRGPSAAFGKIRVDFDQYRHVDGVLLPHVTRQSFDGQPWPDSQRSWSYRLDPPIDARSFQPEP